MGWLKSFYWWFWYYFESMWIKSWAARRPFTYMMRDFLMQHRIWSVIIIACVLTGLVFLNRWNCYVGIVVIALYFIVLGHLVWGAPMKPGEQEEPPYTPG
jgi:hypothetical protein